MEEHLWMEDGRRNIFYFKRELLLWAFGMENSEILGFQFEPTKVLQPDSS